MTLTLFVLSCLALIAFTFVTGFHDAPNATAIPVKTRALTPKIALRTSALFNTIGMAITGIMLGSVTTHWLAVPHNNTGLGLILTALVSAIIWGIITWWFRIPSSSTHALLGGLAGAAWAGRATDLGISSPFSEPLATFLFVPLILAPVVLFVLAWAAVFPFYGLLQRSYPSTVNRFSRSAPSRASRSLGSLPSITACSRAFSAWPTAGPGRSPAASASAPLTASVLSR